jgi:DNA-binding protein Fis
MGYINGIIYIYISISIYGKCDGIYQHHKVEQDLPFFLGRTVQSFQAFRAGRPSPRSNFLQAFQTVFNTCGPVRTCWHIHLYHIKWVIHPIISPLYSIIISYIPFSISEAALPIAIYECCLRKKLQNYTLWILDL